MELQRLAQIHGSDKGGPNHFYCEAYDHHFSSFRSSEFTLLEFGIGGYHYPDRGGGSLFMWSNYFPKALVVGVDIYDKTMFDSTERILAYKGSQTDPELYNMICVACKTPYIVIDDGSHINKDVIQTFKLVFPTLKSGAIYVIEDYETSWYPDHGYGGTRNHNDAQSETTFNFMRKLLLELNHKYSNYPPELESLRGMIASMHFYENICFIYRK